MTPPEVPSPAPKPRKDFDPFDQSFGLASGAAGVVLLVIGLLLALDEPGQESLFFRIMGLTAAATGLYLLIAGAVARGIQLSRR